MRKLITALLAIGLTGVLAACGGVVGGSANDLSPSDVIEAFKDEGLPVEDARKMTKDDFGMSPMKAKEAEIFTTPFVCDGCNVRVLSYDKASKLDEMKDYYDNLGEESAAFFSWTVKHKNILVQMNGDMDEEDYEKYRDVIEGL